MTLYKDFELTNREKMFFVPLALWLSGFLFILQSFTGIWIFIITIPVILINWAYRQKKVILTSALSVLLIFITIAIFSLLFRAFRNFYPPPTVNVENLEQFTANGNQYYHNSDSKILENGNYVDLFICEKELRSSWNKRSKIPYDSADNKGQILHQTLIRYLTSKGLKKDSAGIAALDEKDIQMIENGFSNYIFSRKFSIYPRIYQSFWEIDVYLKTGISGGHSLTQRIEYQRNGIQIIKRNFWFGVGTGDVENEFNKQYDLSGSKLEPKFRLRAHNQLLTFFITFGFIGFLWILFAIIFSVIYEKKYKDLLTMSFLLVIFLSMLNEDTLETHVGISFFSLFFALFVFGYNKKDLKQ